MLKDIKIPLTRNYHSGTINPPIKLYLDILPEIKKMDLELGFFSSSAFQVLSYGLAQFIQNGGCMRIITNSHLSDEDSQLITSEIQDKHVNEEVQSYSKDKSKLKKLQMIMSKREQHFYNCLLYLKSEGRLIIQPVQPIHSVNGMAHTKNCVVSDDNNQLYFSGSTNFTGNALLNNIESLDVSPDWLGDIEGNTAKIEEFNDRFEKIINKTHSKYKYLNKNQLIDQIDSRGENKNLLKLFEDELELGSLEFEDDDFSSLFKVLKQKKIEFEEIVEKNEMEPHFPYFDNKISKPRPYQEEAYNEWVKNDRKGLFAMATGTGKTITSLNCVLNDFKINNYYKFIVLVPTTALAKQWVDESKYKFNFQETIVCCSINNNWKNELKNIGKNVVFQRDSNYSIITTYATFKGLNFQTIIKDYFSNDYDKITLIADEAHTMGSQGFLKVLPNYILKRIGLSATPERQFDVVGNSNLNEYFSVTQEKYTYEYNMKTAIENKVLCKYYYYPKIVSLEQSEQDEYLRISKKLAKCIDPKTGKYHDSDYVNNLLIKRKNVIHKASRKVNELISIIDEIGKENFKNAFIYVPEGAEVDYTINDSVIDSVEEETEKLIDQYLTALYEKYKLRMAKFTGETKNRDQIFDQFKTEKLDALLAMKCLDEGVDIPQTKYAIFCSSTGNPRQYVQRRGRVLRNFTGKTSAVIYDLIIKPIIDHTNTDEKLSKLEKNIFISELKRLVNFAVLSKNKDSCLNNLENICYDLDIDIYELANKELENYK